MVQGRLAAASAGVALILAAVFAFGLTSHPRVAGTNGVEAVRPSVSVEQERRCQRISRVPRGADRMELLVTYVTSGAKRLNVTLGDRRGPIASGILRRAEAGERRIQLRPRTRTAHRARLCLSNPGPGRIMISGDHKRIPGSDPERTAQKRGVASVLFMRPGSSTWVSQIGTITDRYANAQTGLTGRWSVWLAAVFAAAAVALAIWALLGLPGRRA